MAEENTPAPENTPEEQKQDWTDMIEVRNSSAAAPAAGSSDSKILNQEEIDTLFGYTPDEEEEGYAMKTGVQAILNASMVSYERLPMLDIVFDRLIRMMATSLRNFTQDNVEVSLDNIESMRFGEYIDSLTLPTLLGVFKAEEWDNYGLMSVDSSLVYSMVDVLLGGRRGTAAMRIEGRPYTTIELNLVKDMIDLILSDLSTAFDPITSVTFSYDRLETNPRFATISRLSNAVIVARLRIDMEDRGGKIDLMIPYATLEPIRDLLLQMFMGERYGRDAIWENHLIEQLWETDIQLQAILKEKMITLGDIAKWEKGSFLPLDMYPHDDVSVICGDVPLFTGSMGRKEENVVIKIQKKADKMDSLELIINLAIIALLIPTIIYAYKLNKNLSLLRQNQSSLSKLISSLNEATYKAENSIPKLKSVTEHSSEGLKEVIDSAKNLKDDLTFINERADNLADRLENVISAGREIKPAAPAGRQPSAPFAEDKEDKNEDSRSLAEMELLKALRSIK